MLDFDWHKVVGYLGTFAVVGTILGWFPYIAAVAAFLWYVVQLWESRTVQHWWVNRQMVRRLRKIARLKEREKIIAAQLIALQTVRAAQKEAKALIEDAAVQATKLRAETERELLEKPPANEIKSNLPR